MDAWVSWTIAYILIGIMLAIAVEGINKWHRLVFIVWPIPIATFLIFAVYAIIKGLYIEVCKYIKNKRNKQ